MVYIFDTSSLRVLGNYFPGRFPSFWEKFDKMIIDETVQSVREVFNEIQRQSTKLWLLDWVKANRQVFLIPGPSETAFLGEIFAIRHFRTLVGEKQRLRGQPVADPFVIAAAKIKHGCVVTEEGLRPNAAKIPNVCEQFDVECTNVEGFLEKERWTF